MAASVSQTIAYGTAKSYKEHRLFAIRGQGPAERVFGTQRPWTRGARAVKRSFPGGMFSSQRPASDAGGEVTVLYKDAIGESQGRHRRIDYLRRQNPHLRKI